MSAEQVDRLLEMQGNSYLRLVEILTENGILTLAEIECCLRNTRQSTVFLTRICRY